MLNFLSQFFTARLVSFYSGGIISYLSGYVFAGRETYQQGILPSMIFSISQYQVHLHHWLMSLIIMIFMTIPLFLKKKISIGLFLFMFGFSSGLILHGTLSYSDWYSIVIRR